MSKTGFNYYDSFSMQAAYFEEMALNLASGIKRGELGTKGLLDALHTFENDADAVNHKIQQHLVSDFVVPMERNGMNALAHALDDVSDAIEEIALEAYIRGVHELPEGGDEMVNYLTEAATNLREAVGMVRDMSKQSKQIRDICIKVQTAESNCDGIFIDSAFAINTGDAPFEKRNADFAIVSVIEKAMDAAENAAESVEAIVAENM